MKLKVQEDDMHRERFGSIKIPYYRYLHPYNQPLSLSIFKQRVKKNLTKKIKIQETPHISQPKQPKQTKGTKPTPKIN